MSTAATFMQYLYRVLNLLRQSPPTGGALISEEPESPSAISPEIPSAEHLGLFSLSL